MPYPLFHPSSEQPQLLFLTSEEFARAYPAESEHVEWKTGASGSKLQEAVVAFSNTDGGVILIGIADSGHVVGREASPGLVDDLHRIVREAHDPGRYSINGISVAGKPVTVLSVEKRIEGFAQTSSGRVLVRRGTMNVPLLGAELRRFVNERALGRFEETDSGLSADQIDRGLFEELARAFSWSGTAGLEQLRQHGLLTPGSPARLTVAGALYLLQDPAACLGKASIEILRYPGENGEYDRRVEVSGPLHHQLRQAVQLVGDELGTELVVLGLRRHELPRLPGVVLREVLSNALAHRSYEFSGTAIRVELRPQVVRVISPGGLPEPVTVDNIREAQSARNPSVIYVLRRFGLAEDVGRGVDVILDSMQDELLDPPVFEDTGHSVVVTLPVQGPVAPMERAWIRELEDRGEIAPRDRLLLVHAARGVALTNSFVRELLGVAADEARRSLQRLRDGGFLVQEGARGGATYALTASLAPPAGLRLSQHDLEALVLQLAAESDRPLTNTRVRDRTGLDRIAALRVLTRLVEQGRLVRLGSRRGTRYVLPR